MNKRTVRVIGNRRIKVDRPKIYACTHIGRLDRNNEKNISSDWNEACDKFINSIMCDTENGYMIEKNK